MVVRFVLGGGWGLNPDLTYNILCIVVS